MKKILCICDLTGAAGAVEVRYVTGRSMDPSGNGYCDDCVTLDVHPDVLMMAAKEMLADCRDEGRHSLWNRIKKTKGARNEHRLDT